MRIEKIILNNFRIYNGDNHISFNNKRGKNVSLIAGKNGFGKTTFLTSLIWGLYGNLMSQVEVKYKKDIKIFIQVNIGNELQKSGINPNDVDYFKNKCVNELNLNIVGLMCLPPKNKEASIYFDEMNNLLKKVNLKELSMGMSNDYLEAINYNSSYVRIGTKIFGTRD